MSVCLSVYPSVPALAASASVETSKQRYSRVSLRDLCVELRKNLPFKSYGVKKPIANHRQPLSRSFRTNETQQLPEGQLVGQMLLQRLATGATGVKQARYRRRGLLGAARHSYAHVRRIPVSRSRIAVSRTITSDRNFVINPRRACAARFFVSVSLCLSVTALAATAFVSTCDERHLRHITVDGTILLVPALLALLSDAVSHPSCWVLLAIRVVVICW